MPAPLPFRPDLSNRGHTTSGHHVIGRLFDAPPSGTSGSRRLARLWLEGASYTSCALLMANAFGIPQAGFFAVFLAAAGLAARFEAILEENRRDILLGVLGSPRSNGKTAASVLALFLGSFSAFSAAALWIGEARMSHSFAFVLDVADLGHDTILTRPFASAPALFVHNAVVLLAFVALSAVYRAYGALLALEWNACIWALVLTFLVRRGMTGSSLPPALFVLMAAVAVLPHLILEAGAYIAGSLAAIFLSKGLMKYDPTDPVLRDVMRAVASLAAVAIIALLLGAVVEASLPRFVLSSLGR